VNSSSLSPEDKELIMSRFGSHIGRDGVLRAISQQPRSQEENRELAIECFVELLRNAIKQIPVRKKTRVSKTAKLHRLEEKKRYSMLKDKRSKRVPIEE
jgi:ribosome-associated protein